MAFTESTAKRPKTRGMVKDIRERNRLNATPPEGYFKSDLFNNFTNAIQDNDIKKIEKCMEMGANPYWDQEGSDQYLRWCIDADYGSCTVETIKFLVDHGLDLKRGKENLDYLLCFAVTADSIELATFFLKEGASIHLENMERYDSLIYLAVDHYCSAEMVLFLLANGADVDKKDHGDAPRGCYITPLSLWAFKYDTGGQYYSDNKVLKVLLEAGADPNAHDLSGWTPFARFVVNVCALSEEGKEAISLFLKHGADPTLKTIDGDDPFTLCIYYEQEYSCKTDLEMVEFERELRVLMRVPRKVPVKVLV